ncbi:MAG: AAA family ATPase [Bacteroidia bacterium]|nr:AAA family ATPase [Bacteroidia bacterium]
MRRYPVGIQDFEKLRKEGYIYIDKTRQIYELARSGSYYFLSRPRRFGKSLLLSTLKYFFLGRRDLFEGLWVDHEASHAWEPHPVLHVSFNAIDYKSLGLREALEGAVNDLADQYGVALAKPSLATRFRELIQALGSGPRKVVLLIDEYDKPLIDYLDDLPQAQAHREILKNFFSVIKDSDPFIRFFLITGVSKFSKVSLFSDLNHLKDLTLHPRHATLTGYTPEEMDQYFGEDYPALAAANRMSLEAVKAEIQRWYNGYQWEVGKPVCNPFSVLNLFDSGRFANYWWDTGTPTFLLKALEREFAYDFTRVEAGNAVFESYTLESMNWVSLMFQTGYLTIQSYDPEYQLYTLSYPNREVKDAMFQHLLAVYRHRDAAETQPIYAAIKRSLDTGDLEEFIRQTDILFSTIPGPIFLEKREAFFHAVLHLTFQGLGLLTHSEVMTAQGRADCVVQSKSGIYVMEFKLDGSAEAALEQIRAKRYGHRFLGQGQPVTAVGISFSSEQKAVAGWKAVDYAQLAG